MCCSPHLLKLTGLVEGLCHSAAHPSPLQELPALVKGRTRTPQQAYPRRHHPHRRDQHHHHRSHHWWQLSGFRCGRRRCSRRQSPLHSTVPAAQPTGVKCNATSCGNHKTQHATRTQTKNTGASVVHKTTATDADQKITTTHLTSSKHVKQHIVVGTDHIHSFSIITPVCFEGKSA